MSSANSLEPSCSNAITVTETNSDQAHDTEPDSDQSHESISQERNSEQQIASSPTKKPKTDFIDLSLSKNKYELLFPDFYYSNIEKGWYCIICSLFAQSIFGPTSFVNKVGDFGDHPNRTVSRHLSSSRHQNGVKINRLLKNLSCDEPTSFSCCVRLVLQPKYKNKKTIDLLLKASFGSTGF